MTECRAPQVGDPAWFDHHHAVEQLKLQAHQSVACHTAEFVKEALVREGKLEALVHELLLTEASALPPGPGAHWDAVHHLLCPRGILPLVTTG